MQRHKRTVFGRNGFTLVDTLIRVFDGNLRARRSGEMFNLKGKPHRSYWQFFCMIVLLGFSHKWKTTDFPMEPPCKSGRKKLSKSLEEKKLCFLERGDLQLQEISILLVVFCVFAMLEVQNRKFQLKCCQKRLVFLDHNTLMLWFFETDRPQENQLLTFMINFFNRSVNIYLLLIFSGKSKIIS